jgi:glucokinase
VSLLLVGDVGGTKTDLALLADAADPRSLRARRRFRSADYPSLADVAREFIASVAASVTHACFDVAGPVVNGHARLTNLPWQVSADALRTGLGLDGAWVINDLAAVAYALPLLREHELHVLQEGDPMHGGALAVIAAGTGLGEAFAVWDGERYRGFPSEGGHADFAPGTPLQIELLRYLQPRLGHVSQELVCSGIGIPHIYDFLRDSGHAVESPELARRLSQADDRTPLIVENALSSEAADPLCAATLYTFVAVLGAEAGNLALKVLATGGVYVGGGIAPRIISLLEGDRFLAAFRNKGRFAKLLARIPVRIITGADAALVGAASYAMSRMAGATDAGARVDLDDAP